MKIVASFYGDVRRNADSTWKGGVDSSLIPQNGCPHSDDGFNVVPDKEYYYASDYSCICLVNGPSTKVSSFYQSHWLIDLGTSNHIMPYLENFSNLL